ncbi:3992_t:CDS:2 [Acaulospora colombiana]|uniref:3992_t:CDS:1 n=1 Tax=Acaulospora colombiana TaxID=27376 RepID=A0ACA9K1Q5_9GLOM|nr:3992_t:CDS:2 [Acaulospora colombiana]
MIEDFKISFSLNYQHPAFKLVAARAYHHGTMLIDTDLNRIGRYLTAGKRNLITKGVESVPSLVTNLREYSSTMNHYSFCDAIIEDFREHYRSHLNDTQPIYVDESVISKIPKIVEYREEFKSWDWTFGQTPEFTYEFEKSFAWGCMKAFFKSKNGIITAVTLTPSDMKYENLASVIEDSLEGNKYDSDGITRAITKSLVDAQLSNIGSGSVATLPTPSSTHELRQILADIKNWILESL